MLRRAAQAGGRDALAALGLSQPSLGSVGIKAPSSAPGLPSAKAPSMPKPPSIPSVGSGTGGSSLGVAAAKVGYAVGMGASTSSDGTGAARGEPADQGRRPRSAIERAFQSNVDMGETSTMADPGVVVP